MGDARGVKRPAASDEDAGVRDEGDRSRRARAAAPPADDDACIDLTAASPSPRKTSPDPEFDPHGLSAVAACVPCRGESGDPRVAPRLRRSTPASNTTRLCSADFDAFTTIRKPDHGFGCGYRNLQTILSALARDPSLAPLLGGAARLRPRRSVDPDPDAEPEPAVVPTVSELQYWLEHAWSAGFDVAGAAQLGTLVGTREWIGATEILTLLRFAGVRAEVSDFEGRGGGDLGDAVWEWAWRRFDPSEPTAPGVLQWRGHSVAVVGASMEAPGEPTRRRILVLDPSTVGSANPNGERGARVAELDPARLRKSAYQGVFLPGGGSRYPTEEAREESKVIRCAEHVKRA